MNAAKIALAQLQIEKKHFGGALLKNSHAKSKRPVTLRAPMHLVLQSSIAKGPFSLHQHQRRVQKIVYDQGRKFGIRIYRLANAGHHFHMILSPGSRRGYQGFIRAISGLIARAALRVERGQAKGLKFWDQRPFSRVISWGREYALTCEYILQDNLDAMGFLPVRRSIQRAVRRELALNSS